MPECIRKEYRELVQKKKKRKKNLIIKYGLVVEAPRSKSKPVGEKMRTILYKTLDILLT